MTFLTRPPVPALTKPIKRQFTTDCHLITLNQKRAQKHIVWHYKKLIIKTTKTFVRGLKLKTYLLDKLHTKNSISELKIIAFTY